MIICKNNRVVRLSVIVSVANHQPNCIIILPFGQLTRNSNRARRDVDIYLCSVESSFPAACSSFLLGGGRANCSFIRFVYRAAVLVGTMT